MSKVIGFGMLGAAACFLGALLGGLALRADRRTAARPVELAPTEILFGQDVAERLRRARAGPGALEIALAWNNDNDLDLHCVEPSKEEISFEHRQSATGGRLDVDCNDAPPFVPTPVEHIVWEVGRKVPQGKYRLSVAHRARHTGPDPTEFICDVVVKGDGIAGPGFTRRFTGSISQGQTLEVGSFDLEAQAIPRPSVSAIAWATGKAALWAALVAAPFALVLRVAQGLCLRRGLPLPGTAALVLAGGLLTGLIAGGAAQALVAYLERSDALEAPGFLFAEAQAQLGRLAGWLVLGGLLGLGTSLLLPRLPLLRGAAGGALGGLAAGWAFVVAAGPVGEPAARWVAASLLGLFVGLTAGFVRATFREAWLEVADTGGSRTVPLGPEPVAIGRSAICAVRAETTTPVALRYWLEQGQVWCEDVPTGQTACVGAGASRKIGPLTLVVRGHHGEPADTRNAPPPAVGTTGFCLLLPSRPAIPLSVGRPVSTADLPGTESSFGTMAAEVTHNPQNPTMHGLTNRTSRPWSVTLVSGETHQVEPGRTIRLAPGTRINFGPVAGIVSGGLPAHRSKPASEAAVAAALLACLTLCSGAALADWYRRCAGLGEPATSPDDLPAAASGPAAPAPGAKVLKGHIGSVHAVAFSPDGRLVASASADRTVCVWRVADGSLVQELKGHGDEVHSVAFHPDGALATCSLDRTIRIWNVASGQVLHTIEGVYPGGRIAFSPDGAFLAGLGGDGRLRLWQAGVAREAQAFDGWVFDPVFHSGGAFLVGRTRQSLQVWDVRARICARRITGLRGAPHCVACNRDGSLIAAGLCLAEAPRDETKRPDEGPLVLYGADGVLRRALAGHSNCVTCTAFSPADGSLLASGSSDRTVKLWRVPDGELLETLHGHTKEVWGVAFSPDARLLASGGNDGTVRLWELPDLGPRRARQKPEEVHKVEGKLPPLEVRTEVERQKPEKVRKIEDRPPVRVAQGRDKDPDPPATTAPYDAIDRHALDTPEEAERSIRSLALHLTETATTNREKSRAIFRWIVDRIRYNAEAFLAGKSFGDCSAEAVLQTRTSVCAGYSGLFEALAREAGLEVVTISGSAKGYGYVPGEQVSSNHAWNAVRIEGQWHGIDATWGAGHVDKEKGFVKELSEEWFLVPPEQLILSHFPADPARQFLKQPIDASTFRRWPKVPSQLFALGIPARDVVEALNEESFRGLVKAHAVRGHLVRVHKAPLKKHLATGARIDWQIEGKSCLGLAIINAGEWQHVTPIQGVYRFTVTPRKGALKVSARCRGKGSSYWTILEYVVE
jgi:transglutaminase-like putative cysteine protease